MAEQQLWWRVVRWWLYDSFSQLFRHGGENDDEEGILTKEQDLGLCGMFFFSCTALNDTPSASSNWYLFFSPPHFFRFALYFFSGSSCFS